MWKKPENDQSTGPSVFTNPAPGTQERQLESKPSERALIGPSVVIRGDIDASEDLLIQGEVHGTITLKDNTVTIGRNGRIKANVFAKKIIVEGEITGDLMASETIILHRSGNVRGNVTAPRVTLEDGARLKGNIDMDVKEEISSKSDNRSTNLSEMPKEKANGALHA